MRWVLVIIYLVKGERIEKTAFLRIIPITRTIIQFVALIL